MLKHFFTFLAGVGVLGDTVLPLLAGDHIAWLRWRIPIIICGVVALIGLAIQLILQYREDKLQRKEAGEFQKTMLAFMASFLAAKGIVPDSQTDPTTISLGPDISKSKGIHSALDAEIYRLAPTGKAMSTVVEMAHSFYQTMGRLQEFAIDADILVELYIVNATTEKQYLRDFVGTVEVDGKTLPLIRQNDFYAWEFNGQDYEYCLNLSDNKLDHTQLETLTPLFKRIPIDIEARQPLEGWAHFIVKDIDPYKLRDNRTYKFFLVDSLGNEHPILKASTTKRAGEISVRPVPHH